MMVTPKVHPREDEESQPKKRSKVGMWKLLTQAPTREAATQKACGLGKGSQEASRGDGSGIGSPWGKEPTPSFGIDPLVKRTTRPKSKRDLCQTRVRSKEETFMALYMANLPKGEPGTSLELHWSRLMANIKF
ncbi:hypothetical protein GW17_00016949 [Ensete ventricosum]|nr:hypothetical protein GW17_00016949 [Ensete ventricosum]